MTHAQVAHSIIPYMLYGFTEHSILFKNFKWLYYTRVIRSPEQPKSAWALINVQLFYRL